MGFSEIVKAGSKGILNSGGLVVCSVFVGKVFRGDKYLCAIMCHRGLETHFEFIRKAEIALSDFGSIENLTIEPIALQTAPNTDISKFDQYIDITKPLGQHPHTDVALIENLNSLFKIETETLYKLKEFGPGYNSRINICKVIVDELGNINVPKRKGMFECCAIL